MSEEKYTEMSEWPIAEMSTEERKLVLWLVIKGSTVTANHPDEMIMTFERFRAVINKATEIKDAYTKEHPGKQIPLQGAILLACETDLERRDIRTWIEEYRLDHL